MGTFGWPILLCRLSTVGQRPSAPTPPAPFHHPCLLVQFATLRGVNKSNAVVDRGRLDHFNGCHIKRMVAMSLPNPTPNPTTAMPDTSQAAASAGGSASPPVPAASGDAEWTPPRRKDGTLPLSLPDTPQLARLRELVMPAVIQRLEGLVVAGVPAMSDQGTPERINSLLLAQVERVHLVSEFVPLLAPFLASRAAFPAWLAAQADNTAAVARLIKAASKGHGGASKVPAQVHAEAKGAGGEVAPAATLADVLRRADPVISAIRAAWAGMDDAAFAAGGGMAAAQHAVKAQPPGAAVVSGPGVMLPLRWRLTGCDVGPSISDVLRLLGRDECLWRLALSPAENRTV